jgi:hypothetical protein
MTISVIIFTILFATSCFVIFITIQIEWFSIAGSQGNPSILNQTMEKKFSQAT